MNVRFAPARRLRGRIAPPADKSISHRAAIVGGMAAEPLHIDNFLDAADTRSTLAAVQALGAIVQHSDDQVLIRGCGMRNARAPAEPIDVGNAGTLMRLLPGWLAFQPGQAFVLDGDESIRRRPVDRIAEPLVAMGARIEAREGRFAPFTVHGGPLGGIEYALPRDHTERMLLRAGAAVNRGPAADGGQRITVGNADELELEALTVPGDMSSAAFLIAAGVLTRGSRLLLEGVGVNWTRTGFLRILQRMGAIVIGELEEEGALRPDEPVCDLDVCHGPIVATTVQAAEVPLAIDELPLVALLGCFAEGETVVRGAGELRVKESDRIATVVDGLRGLGADIEAFDDGFAVRGSGTLRGGRIESYGDHRLAMLGAVAGLASQEGVEVVGMEAAEVSYPGFAADIAELSA